LRSGERTKPEIKQRPTAVGSARRFAVDVLAGGVGFASGEVLRMDILAVILVLLVTLFFAT